MYLANKTSAEVNKFTTAKTMKNIHLYKGLCLSKTSFADYQELEEEGSRKGALARLLINKGISKH